MSEDERVTWVRSECDYLQSRMNDIDHVIPKEELRKRLSVTRDCMTTVMRHMPKIEHLYQKWRETNVRGFVGEVITAKDTGREAPYWAVERLLELLEYPQRFHDNYDDMFGEHFMTFEQYKAKHIVETRRQHTDDAHYVQEWSEEIEKKLHKQYERDKKEWEKEHGD